MENYLRAQILKSLPEDVCSIIDEIATGWEPTPTAKLMENVYVEKVYAGGRAGWLDTWWYHEVSRFYHFQFFPANFVGIDGLVFSEEATKARLQNEIEQDRIAKALEPVVADYHMMKLPEVLEDMILWWATEPSSTAKLMKELRFKRIRCCRLSHHKQLVINFLYPSPFDIGYRVFYKSWQDRLCTHDYSGKIWRPNMVIKCSRGEGEISHERNLTRIRLANEIEQDKISMELDEDPEEYMERARHDIEDYYRNAQLEMEEDEREQYERDLLDGGGQLWAVDEMAERRANELRRERETERER